MKNKTTIKTTYTECHENNNKIGKVSIIIEHKDFDRKFVDNNKEKLSNKITKEITKLESCKNFQINGNVKFGSIEFIALFTCTLANYGNAKKGFLSFIEDIRNIEPKIIDVCHKVFNLTKEQDEKK